jgi:hypothetical protein
MMDEPVFTAMRFEKQQRILKRLQERGVDLSPCKECACEDYRLAEGLVRPMLSDDSDKLFAQSTLPLAAVMCTRCGHTRFFAVGPLGFMKDGEVSFDG